MREVPGSNPGRALHFFSPPKDPKRDGGAFLRKGLDTLAFCLERVFFPSNFPLLFLLTFTLPHRRSRGVMVSTLDSESSDPSSNLGGTYVFILPPFTQPGLVGGLCMGKVGLQSAVLDCRKPASSFLARRQPPSYQLP